MRLSRYLLASAEVLLLFPSVLFMTALFMRNVQPVQFEPAHTAQQIVAWYAARTHVGLWLFLMLFPFAVFISGCATLMRRWRHDAELREAAIDALTSLKRHWEPLIFALTTVTAGVVLAIVALHVASG